MLNILNNHDRNLGSIGTYDAVWAFQDHFKLADKEVMRAILECFWLATNKFLMPNGELGFFLREFKEITDLPIIGELYEEYVPLDSELEAESEEF